MTAPRDRYAQCHGDCTTDCGACKGHGRPVDSGLSDPRPHSRACGWRAHPHGTECHSNCPTCGGRTNTPPTPVHDPGLDHLLEEVAAEVLRQDAAGLATGVPHDRGFAGHMRGVRLRAAAHALRDVRAIDQDAGGEQP